MFSISHVAVEYTPIIDEGIFGRVFHNLSTFHPGSIRVVKRKGGPKRK